LAIEDTIAAEARAMKITIGSMSSFLEDRHPRTSTISLKRYCKYLARKQTSSTIVLLRRGNEIETLLQKYKLDAQGSRRRGGRHPSEFGWRPGQLARPALPTPARRYMTVAAHVYRKNGSIARKTARTRRISLFGTCKLSAKSAREEMT
jgi:hypothetical protein